MAAYQIINADATTPEHYALLSLAVEHWHDDQFSDAQVAQVKELFEAAFARDGKTLKGSAISDAIMLRAPEDDRLFYVAQVLPSKEIRWVKLAVRNRNFDVNPEVSWDLFCMFMHAVPSASKRVDSTRGEILGDEDQNRETYSPELVARVTGREPGDTRPLPRETATLRQMYDEAMKLGFVGKDHMIAMGGIVLDFKNADALDSGFAPLTFTVHFKPDSYQRAETEEEAKVGVFIDEMYGPDQIKIKTWGDWDKYLNDTMRD
jgi:hypothetical protein